MAHLGHFVRWFSAAEAARMKTEMSTRIPPVPWRARVGGREFGRQAAPVAADGEMAAGRQVQPWLSGATA